jgi:hypothetical protein
MQMNYNKCLRRVLRGQVFRPIFRISEALHQPPAICIHGWFVSNDLLIV